MNPILMVVIADENGVVVVLGRRITGLVPGQSYNVTLDVS